MNVKKYNIFGFKFQVQDKELKDPVYRNIRGLNKRKFCTPIVKLTSALLTVVLIIIIVVTSLVPIYLGQQKTICSSNPCLNNGKCFLNGSSFQCTCLSPYNGNQCQYYNKCSGINNKCLNNAQCIQNNNDFKCVCPNGYNGSLCENYNSCWNWPCEGCTPTAFNSLSYICPCYKFIDSKCVSEIIQPLGVSLKLVGLKDGRLAGSFDDFTIKITNDSSFSNYSNFYGHSNNINALVELNNQILASGSCDKNIIFWNLTSMSKLSTINAQQNCIQSLISMNINNKNYLLSGGQSNGIKIWNEAYSNVLSVSSPGPVSSLAYLDQFRYLAVGSQKSLTIFEMVNYQYTSSNLPVYTGVLNAIVVLPTSLYYVSGSSDSTIKIWNTTSNTVIKTLTPGHTGSVNALAVLNSTQYIVSGSDDMTLKIWNSTSFQLITSLTDNINNPILSIAIVPSTQYIVSGTMDQIIVWTSGIDSASFKYLFSIADPGYSLAILPLTEAIVSTSSKQNGQINLWNSTSFSELPIASSTPSPNLDFKFVHFAVVPSTRYIVASYQLATIFISDSSSFKSITNLTGHATPVMKINVVPSSENIVSVDLNGIIKVWSSKSFYCIATLNGRGPIASFSLPVTETIVGTINNEIISWQITYYTSFTANTLNGFPYTMDSSVTALAFPNSQKLAVGLSGSAIRIYDITVFTYIILYLDDKVTCLLSINNGQYLAAGSDSGSKKISIWDSNFNKIQDLNVHNGRINSLTMWANQSYLVSSSMDTSIITWKAATTFTQTQILIRDKRQTESIIELKNGILASASDDFTVKIWNQSNIYQLKTSLTGHTNNVFSLVEIPSLNQFATGSKDRTIIIWSSYDLTRIYTLYGHLRSVISLELITTNNNQSIYLASGSCDKTIIIWDLNTYKQKTILRRHSDCVNALNFYKKKYLLSGSNDGRIIVWNAVTFVWQQDLIKLNQPIFAVKSSPFNLFSSYLAFGSADKNISVFGDSYSFESNFDDFNGNVYCLAFLPKSKKIVGGSGDSDDGLIWLWNSTSYVLIDYFKAHNARVDALAILPSKQYIVSGSDDNTIKIWNSTSYECIDVLKGHTGPVVSLAIVQSTEFIISGSEDTKIKVWNSTSSNYSCIKTLDIHNDIVNTLSIMPSDEYLISGSRNGQIIIWNNKFNFSQQLSPSHSPSCYAFAVLRSGNEKLVSSAGNDIQIWSWESANLIASLVGHTQRVSSLAVLNSTQSIVSGSFDFTVKIWDSTTFQCIATLRSKLNAFIDSNILSLAILPNKESIFVGSNFQFEVWSLKEFSYLCNLIGHNNSVYSIDFAQNNALISGSQDQTIINWDLTECHLINVVSQNKDGVLSVLSLRNGDLVTSAQDKTIKLWETSIFHNISKIY